MGSEITATVEEAREYMGYLMECCLREPPFKPDEISSVLRAWDEADTLGGSTERNGGILVSLTDGRVGVVTDGEDFTGHG